MIDPNPPTSSIHIEWPPADKLRSRHKPPRDFRWLVGGLARTMIAVGVLIFALVGYQLWGTRLQEARSQDHLAGKFSKLLAQSGDRAATAPGSSAVAASTTVAAASTTVAAPAASPATTEGAPTTTDGASSSAETASSSIAPGAALTDGVAEGDPIADLAIPKIGLDKIVVSGVSTGDLRKGPGHFPDTPLPGQRGNAAIAGHRTTFGAPFYRLDELERGDPITVTTLAGRFTYNVTDTKIVEPTDFEVLAPSDDAVLTLISCHPRLSAAKRIVVRAVLDTAASPVPAAPSSSTTAASSSTVASSAGSTAPSTATTLVAVGTEGESTTTLPAARGDAGTEGATGAGPNSAAAVALRQGWFDDSIAWADVAIWGGILTGISLLSWRLSRRFNRNLIGALVGIIPFAIALYFFFENFSRLLPPNL